ncbi:MAG: heparinase II/III family protein [Clostridia bacterium]|nr:heparinase II/III family protein [Clostridia bacterium]
MDSNIRVFKEREITAKGNILPLSEFEFARDIPNKIINDEIGAYFVAQAEKMLSEEIPLLPLSLYRDKALTDVRSRFEKPHHRRRNILMHLTLAEAYERKGRFTEKLADVLWAILEETCWVIPAHYYHSPNDPKTPIPEVYTESQMPGLDLYAASCCASVALTKYLLKEQLDAISPVICKRIDHLIYLRGIRPFVSVTFSWAGENGTCNNWVTNITSSILTAAALTLNDLELRERVAEKAMHLLDNFSSHYPVDGWCDEGPGYWSGAGGNYFDCLEILEDMSGGKIKVYDHFLIKRMGEYIASANIDGKYYLNFADAKPVLEQTGKLIMRFAEKCGSEKLYSFGRMTAANNPVNTGLFFGMIYRVYKNCLIEEIKEAPAVLGEKRLWYEENKIAIFRENEDTSKGLYLAFKGGHNRESHNHNDVGCFVVYANGKPVIIDPSHGSYDNGFFGPTRYKRWYMKSSYHSIPTVDGIEQSAGKAEYSSSEETIDKDFNIVSMELKNAFPKSAGIVSMKRTCSLCDGNIKVKDDISLDHTGDIQFNYVTVDEPRVLDEKTLLLAENVAFEYECDGAELVIERVENTYLPYEDLNFRSVWGRDCLWRICLKTKASEKTAVITIK